MKILVAGASGVVGRQVVELLKQRGHQVRTLSKDPERARSLRLVADDVRLADATRGPDPLVGQRRRHPDVGEDDVRVRLIDGVHQLVVVGRDGDDVNVVVPLEQRDDPSPQELSVLGQHQTQRGGHGVRLIGVAGSECGAGTTDA